MELEMEETKRAEPAKSMGHATEGLLWLKRFPFLSFVSI